MSRKIPMFLMAAGFAAAALLVGLDTRAVDQGKGRLYEGGIDGGVSPRAALSVGLKVGLSDQEKTSLIEHLKSS